MKRKDAVGDLVGGLLFVGLATSLLRRPSSAQQIQAGAMLHFYLTDSPQVKKGDRALCGHVSDGEQSEGDKKCPICVALKRAEGLKEGRQ